MRGFRGVCRTVRRYLVVRAVNLVEDSRREDMLVVVSGVLMSKRASASYFTTPVSMQHCAVILSPPV